MKNILLVTTLIFALSACAHQKNRNVASLQEQSSSIPVNGVFGTDVSILAVDRCRASKILDTAVAYAGVDILHYTNFPYAADCSQLSGGPFREADLQRACSSRKTVRCFGYIQPSSTGICVVNPRAETTREEYANASQTEFKRPRFDAIYSFTTDANGYQQSRSWQMDGDGCMPIFPKIALNECKDLLSSYFTGGPTYPSLARSSQYAREYGNRRFGDGQSSGDMWSQIDKLASCKDMLPNYQQEYEAAHRNQPREE